MVSNTGSIHNKYSLNDNKPKQNELECKYVGMKITKLNINNLIACSLRLSN